MTHNLILRVIAKWMIPVILLFALYVQFHGDYSPGGGFQAGVIFTTAFLLHALAYGRDATMRIIPENTLKYLSCLGVLIYAGVGVTSMVRGGNFLDYSRLASTPISGQHIGIILIELGVGITVASVMLLIFFTFSRRVIDQ
ncbi:Na(+)/H(+) antiporter subunit B [Alteromonas aestuariivivens]|uniref:Na(+)/H(+) antiporter subunit B n=1 Tax=Alteromonas aestuariivivens TaxID=1938339 RepID=A0A3D8M661_9ALTE|nr:Na(+)/H(+) antiporter subunit B [Alteromonas aestuariivivens]RDV24652.1 Na(+)/H(+) antiporter subunit B [Alteromonas aestuariivivens]